LGVGFQFHDQWFNGEYQNNLPVDDSFYMKHAVDSESFSVLPRRSESGDQLADEEEENARFPACPKPTTTASVTACWVIA